MKIFQVEGKLYLRVVPAKTLFHSTMVHEVVNRGDVFAIRLEDSVLTVIAGNLVKGEYPAYVMPLAPSSDTQRVKTEPPVKTTVSAERKKLKTLRDDIAAALAKVNL